ncbi:MAG: acetylglutamate kinase [Leptospiraceae bacterium]|nr:acetylglutamate kinase [Leptospiraceae bacterium]MCP5494826.1 acetylglutamate kinase [Leptospiraceae bacterium]
MLKIIDKITSLLETLPYIKYFAGKTVVIKYGGAAMVEEELKDSFAIDIVMLKYVGIKPVIVHGGGPEINALLDSLNIQSEFVRGRRKTDKKTMEVVEMVLTGKINKQIVSLIHSKGGGSIGISGRDGKLATAEIHKMEVKDEKGQLEYLDLGLVGEIKKINPKIVLALIDNDFIPVISPVAESEEGEPLNINADTMAGSIAGALNAEKLILLTDTKGVLIQDKLRDKIGRSEVQNLIQAGDISGGMIPKVECCLEAIAAGVKKTHIIDGRVPHSILIELFTDQGIGTLIE